MRLHKVVYRFEEPYINSNEHVWSLPGRVLVVSGCRIDATGYDKGDIYLYKDHDDPAALLLLVVDTRYEVVSLTVFDANSTRTLATRNDYGDEWQDTEFLEPLGEILVEENPMPDPFTTRTSFEDAFGRSAIKTLDFLRGLAPFTMARKLKHLLNEMGS